jgi:hypothetical protein
MITKSKRTEWWWRRAAVGASLFALLSNSFNAFGQNHTANNADHLKTATPIKHVVVLIGENRSFDHLLRRMCRERAKQSRTCCRKGSSTLTARPAQIFLLSSSSRRSPRFKLNTSLA